MFACGLFGHRYRFHARGTTMTWSCERCGSPGGVKDYPTEDEASKYAAAFNREDREDLGRRAPLVGLLPLRVTHLVRRLRGR